MITCLFSDFKFIKITKISMITHYVEIIEQITEEEAVTRQPIKVILEVADRAEAREVLPNYENLFEGKNYITRHHIHKHDEESQPCVYEDLSLTDEELDGSGE